MSLKRKVDELSIASSAAGAGSVHVKTKKIKSEKKSTILATEHGNTSLWLVKLPIDIAERWSHANQDDELGTFMVRTAPGTGGKPPTKQFLIEIPESQSVYILDEVSSKVEDLKESYMAFAENSDGPSGPSSSVSASASTSTSQFSLEGRITKRLAMHPQQLGLSANSNRLQDKKRREVRIADIRDVQRSSQQTHTVELLAARKAESKRKAAVVTAAGIGEFRIHMTRFLSTVV